LDLYQIISKLISD